MAICDNCSTELGTSYRIISDYVNGQRPDRHRFCNEVCHVIYEGNAARERDYTAKAWTTVWKDLFMRRR